MTSGDVKTELNTIFRDIFDDDSLVVSEAMSAKDVQGWDSINHINLIVAVERKFRIKLSTRDVSGLNNVGDLIGLILKKQT